MYMKCVLFRNGCKSTAKLSQESKRIILLGDHNHGIEQYNDDIYLSVRKLLNILEKICARFSMMSLAEIPMEEQLPS